VLSRSAIAPGFELGNRKVQQHPGIVRESVSEFLVEEYGLLGLSSHDEFYSSSSFVCGIVELRPQKGRNEQKRYSLHRHQRRVCDVQAFTSRNFSSIFFGSLILARLPIGFG
jgi:hypothetical protein